MADRQIRGTPKDWWSNPKLRSLTSGRKNTFPDAFSNALTISRTDVPFPVPRLYTSQPEGIQIERQLNETWHGVPQLMTQHYREFYRLDSTKNCPASFKLQLKIWVNLAVFLSCWTHILAEWELQPCPGTKLCVNQLNAKVCPCDLGPLPTGPPIVSNSIHMENTRCREQKYTSSFLDFLQFLRRWGN